MSRPVLWFTQAAVMNSQSTAGVRVSNNHLLSWTHFKLCALAPRVEHDCGYIAQPAVLFLSSATYFMDLTLSLSFLVCRIPQEPRHFEYLLSSESGQTSWPPAGWTVQCRSCTGASVKGTTGWLVLQRLSHHKLWWCWQVKEHLI